jgi:flagella basal body P-ring formation protein FlgA
VKYLLFFFLSTQIIAQSFKEQVAENLQKAFPEYEKIEMQFPNNFSSNEKITIDCTRSINLSRGIAYIPVIATKEKKTSSSIVSVKVELFKKILVANRDFGKKELLQKPGFEEKVMNVTKINGNPVSIDFAVSEYRVKSLVKNGDILFEEMIERIPLINSGDKVFAEVRNGNVIVTTRAIARQQGSTGDVIELISQYNKIIKAKIVGSNKVIVE